MRGKKEPTECDIENGIDDVLPSEGARFSGSRGDGRGSGGNCGSYSRDVEQITSLGGIWPKDGSANAETIVVKDNEKHPANDPYKM